MDFLAPIRRYFKKKFPRPEFVFDNAENSDAYYVSSPEPIEQPVSLVLEEVERFDSSDPRLKEYFEENGFVVVKSVASPAEIQHAIELLWEFLSKNAFMMENDPNSWSDRNFCRVGSTRNGILAFNNIQHSKFLWFLRLLPKVKEAFSLLYGDKDLITSYDGANIFRPWHAKQADEYSKTASGWYHVDQGTTKRGFKAAQGLVTLFDVDEETGGFCCIPGSHRDHEELLTTIAAGSRDFVKCPSDFFSLRKKQILVKANAGDLILWDSRTIHANNPAIAPIVNKPTNRLLRAVGYVCFAPRCWASEEDIMMRQNLFEFGIGTTHWPYGIRQNYENLYEGEKKSVFEEVSSEQQQLIGILKEHL